MCKRTAMLAMLGLCSCIPPNTTSWPSRSWQPSAADRQIEAENRRWSIDTLLNTRAQILALQPMAANDPQISESLRLQLIAVDRQLNSLGYSGPR